MLHHFRAISGSPKLLAPANRRIVMAMDLVGRVALLPWRLWSAVRPRPAALGPARRILLMRVDGVGDFCMTAALFPALRKTYPQAHIALLCSTLAKPLAEMSVRAGDLDGLHTIPLGRVGFGRFRALVREIRGGRYDVAADLRGDFRHVLTAWFAGIPRRLGIGYSGFAYLLTDVLPGEQVHQTEEVRRMAERLGVPNPIRQPSLAIGDEERRFADEWLRARGVAEGDGRPMVAFHLSAGMPARLWPLERFIAVARQLHADHGARALVVGAPADKELADAFSAALPEPALIAAGITTLPQSAALMARCNLFIGTDSGPAHIAAAVGCPVVVLFGPGNLTVMRPYSEATHVVKSPQPCDRHCHNKTCAVPERHCLKAIGAADVTAAANVALRREGNAANANTSPRPLPIGETGETLPSAKTVH